MGRPCILHTNSRGHLISYHNPPPPPHTHTAQAAALQHVHQLGHGSIYHKHHAAVPSVGCPHSCWQWPGHGAQEHGSWLSTMLWPGGRWTGCGLAFSGLAQLPFDSIIKTNCVGSCPCAAQVCCRGQLHCSGAPPGINACHTCTQALGCSHCSESWRQVRLAGRLRAMHQRPGYACVPCAEYLPDTTRAVVVNCKSCPACEASRRLGCSCARHGTASVSAPAAR
jgi:hypothetical protein